MTHNESSSVFHEMDLNTADSFSRLDETEDAVFYSRDRLVPHLDSLALETIEYLIDTLVVEESPVILDLMASWDSHIPSRLQSCPITGLGMNRTELSKNQSLSDWIIHDLNRDSTIPFPDRSFDKEKLMNTDSLEMKKKRLHETLQCPHCDIKMQKWAVPENPFEATWDNDYLYICFNDDCPYYVRGWDHIYKSTQRMASYRFMYNPETDSCAPIPVPSSKALKESIIQ